MGEIHVAPNATTSARSNRSWLLASAEIAETTKEKLRQEHQRLDPFELKKGIESKLKKFFTALGNLDCESTKT